MHLRLRLLLIALVWISIDGTAPAQEPEWTAIKAGSLIDGTGAPPLSGPVVLIREGRIQQVGQGLEIPPGARVIDLTGYSILPGLIDCHTHLTSEEPGRGSLNRLEATGADYALVAAENARRMLGAGFTTIRDLGGFDLADLAVKRAIARGFIPGPRMYVATTPISITGGHGDPSNGMSPNVLLSYPTGVANGVVQVRERVREILKRGADHIKFAATGGGLSRGTKPTAQHFTDEEMQAIVDEAHRFGVKVAAHAHGTEGIKAAIRAGVDSIEHGIYLDEEACDLMIEHGTFFVPTLWITDSYFEKHEQWGIPEFAHAKISQFIPTALKSVEMAIRKGVKIALGTDAGVGEHALSGKEFAALVKYGMTPMAAIVAGTSEAARLLGHYDEFGSIEAGKFADIIAVPGSPLTRIEVLEDVRFVMKEGRIFLNSR